jgi:hypothetical protein
VTDDQPNAPGPRKASRLPIAVFILFIGMLGWLAASGPVGGAIDALLANPAQDCGGP